MVKRAGLPFFRFSAPSIAFASRESVSPGATSDPDGAMGKPTISRDRRGPAPRWSWVRPVRSSVIAARAM